MKFGLVSVKDAEGDILAHTVRSGARTFKKGHVLSSDDLALLSESEASEVTVARLEPGDVAENEAAARIAQRLAGANVRVATAFTGRANLYAETDGLAAIDAGVIHRINSIHEAVTVATVSPFARLSRGQMLATVKIIPFAAPRHAVEQAEHLLSKAPLVILPFRSRKVALILTMLNGERPALVEKTRAAIAQRVQGIGSAIVFERQVAHSADAVRPALQDAAACADLILVFGATAITDRRDVIPGALEDAGGTIERFGMPVDPGNLLLLRALGSADVVGLPGCARSAKLNGFDFALWRLATGLPVLTGDVAAMGVGGLLTEIPVRPQPREERATTQVSPKIGAVVLAAGASSRMGHNKLLTELHGAPLVRHVVGQAMTSRAQPVVVVTGQDAERVCSVLSGLPVTTLNNPDFSDGLSTSLKCGLKALPTDSDGAVIVLGDMPDVTPELIDRLIAAFDPAQGRAICLATHNGKRGNPVLFARRFFEEIEALEGDVGARGLLGEYPDLVCEIEAGNEEPLVDIDTPEDLTAYRKAHP